MGKNIPVAVCLRTAYIVGPLASTNPDVKREQSLALRSFLVSVTNAFIIVMVLWKEEAHGSNRFLAGLVDFQACLVA